jgi:hypothetical protein
MVKPFTPLAGVTVIGITGQARAGKDELARAFIRRVPGAERLAFSDAVAAVARLSGEMTQRDPRVMQSIGETARLTDPDCWCRAVYGWIDDRRPRVAVLTGLRHANEYAMVRTMGGFVVAVVRPEAPPVTDRDMAHPVEQGVASMVARADYRVTVPERPTRAAREALFDAHAEQFMRVWAID